MTDPVKAALPDGGTGNLGQLAALLKQRYTVHAFSVQEVKDNDFSDYRYLWVIPLDRFYRYDAEETGPDDDVSIIKDVAGNYFVWVPKITVATLFDHVGTGAPSDAMGDDGDTYFDGSTSYVYLKDSGTWSQIGSLRGDPGAAEVVGTSATSLAIGTGSKAFTVAETDRGWGLGARLRASSDADGANFMEGVVTAYSGTSLTISVDLVGGSGTLDDWTINVAGEPGADGAGSVDSVNGKAGVVVLDPDDLDDSATTNKFASAGQLAKIDQLSVTQAVDLDQLESDVAALANGMVFKDDWDASAGTFPGVGSAQTGWFYYVSVAGTVDSVAFAVGDYIVAKTDNASTTTYASNWRKLDATDAVTAVVGLTGSVSKAGLLAALNVEDGADVTDAANIAAVLAAATSVVLGGTGDLKLRILKDASGDTASIVFEQGGNIIADIGLTGDNKLRIRSTPDNGSNYVNSITVDTSGNVGIGTDAPEAPFHILRSSTNIIHERIDATEYAPTSATRKARGSVGALTQCLSGDVPSAFFGQAYDGSSYVGCGNLRWVLEGDAASGAAPTTVEFWNHTSGSGNSSKLELTSAGTLRPTADNAYTLGDASYRWSAVWAANGTIQTSDERDKHIVGELTFAGAMVDAIDPVLFRWEIGNSIVVPSQTETVIDDGGNEVPKLEVWPIPGTRQHAGFIAQEIRAAMDIAGVDFGAWGLEDRNDPDSGQWIRPDQLVAVLWAALKETRAEVATERERSDQLEQRLAALEQAS